MSRTAPRGMKSAVVAGTLFALAGHLGLIRAFGTVLPFRDQWQCTGVDLLGPWAAGQLTAGNFFSPLNDHWPVLTRLLSFGLLRLNGQWNNLLETTVNALLFATAVGLFLRCILPGLRGAARAGFAAVTGLVLALPITWENTLWGIQSLVYLQILLTLVYLAAVATQQRFSVWWYLGHAAGVAVLFTQHSAVIAHLAAMLLLGWKLARRDGPRAVAATGLGFAVTVVVAFALFFPSVTVTAALRADSWELALDVFLRQLAWPLPHPGWAFLVYLPWLVWAVDRLTGKRLAATDAFLLATGLWVGGQAAAIGYGRAAETFTFASRYCDFLALGWLINLACLVRLWTGSSRRAARIGLAVAGVVWFVAPLKSFWWETAESHAGYNLSFRGEINERNLRRVRDYFAGHDARVLTQDPGTARELFTYPPSLPALLDQPRIQELLPPETGSPRARADHGRLGWCPALLLPLAPWLAAAGFMALGWSLLRSGLTRPVDDAEPGASAGMTLRQTSAVCGAVCVGAVIAWARWYDAGVFQPQERFGHAFAPLEPGVRFADLEFHRGDGDSHPAIAARGAVDTMPPVVRSFWYGTRLRGKTDFRGVLASTPVRVQHRYLVLPFSGHPCFPGNGLRWQFIGADRPESWASYVGADAGTGWNVWVYDAEAEQGREAALYLFDGNDGESGWVGVARPAQTDDATFAARWQARLRAERAEATQRTLAGVAAASALATIVTLAGALWRR